MDTSSNACVSSTTREVHAPELFRSAERPIAPHPRPAFDEFSVPRGHASGPANRQGIASCSLVRAVPCSEELARYLRDPNVV